MLQLITFQDQHAHEVKVHIKYKLQREFMPFQTSYGQIQVLNISSNMMFNISYPTDYCLNGCSNGFSNNIKKSKIKLEVQL